MKIVDKWSTINIVASFCLVAEAYPSVGLHFEHKLIAADLEKGHLTFKW